MLLFYPSLSIVGGYCQTCVAPSTRLHKSIRELIATMWKLALQEICRRGRMLGPSRVDRREVLLVYVDHHVRRLNSSTWVSYGAHVLQGEEKRDQPGALATGRQDSKAGEPRSSKNQTFPSGELVYTKPGGWEALMVRLRIFLTMPWRRVHYSSVLKIRLSGQVFEQIQGRFSQGLALPQLCENLIKAAHDPRIAGVFLQIEPLTCGWGKLDEIRRHIDFYKKSGKFVVGYMPLGLEKEYYLACACQELYVPPGAYIILRGLKVQAQFVGGMLEKLGVEPQVQRIGKYKSFGDQISRKDMTEANREMLTAVLDDLYENWLQQISGSTGKSIADVEGLLEAGIFEVEKLKEGGWITDIKYLDEIEEMLKKRIGLKEGKKLQFVDHKKYSWVRASTLGLSGGRDRIAVLRAVGAIRRAQGRFGASGAEGVSSDEFIKKLRQVRDSNKFKAVVLRIDSPGGDALASDLMWREIRQLAEKKPVIASMADVAASGGYYMAMGAGVVVAESLTLTGSIGVVSAKFNLRQLYERIGFSKETISRGKYADVDAEDRPFTPEEEELFARFAMNAYTSFRNKAALSRAMEVEKMEDVAQGRVWTGKSALALGLVDTVGGFSKAVAIAKQRAGIADSTKVTLVELTKRQTSLLQMLRGGLAVLSSLFEFSQTEFGSRVVTNLVKGGTLVEDILTVAEGGIQARMEGISVDGLGTEFAADVRRKRLSSISEKNNSS